MDFALLKHSSGYLAVFFVFFFRFWDDADAAHTSPSYTFNAIALMWGFCWKRPHTPAGSLWGTVDGIILHSGITVILGPGMVFKPGWCQSRLQWWEFKFSKRGKSCQISVLSTTVRINHLGTPCVHICLHVILSVIDEQDLACRYVV